MLVRKEIRTLQHPTEPETQVVVRLPLSAGDMAGLRGVDGGAGVGVTLDLLASIIQTWTYDEPVTLDSVNSLDIDTFLWLSREITTASGIRSDEKKSSSDTLSSLMPSTADDSPPSSDT